LIHLPPPPLQFLTSLHLLRVKVSMSGVEYDMDDEDMDWLRTFNEQRSLDHYATLSQDNFERAMDRLERDYGVVEQEKIEESHQEGNVESLAFCCVCRDGESEDTNEMLYCEKCNNAVHQACYGVKIVPEGNWMCQTCLLGLSHVPCVLCTNTEMGTAFSPSEYPYLGGGINLSSRPSLCRWSYEEN